MLSDKLKKTFSTLRFRLTLIYSLILFLFTSSFVLAVNLYLNNYFSQEPPINKSPPRIINILEEANGNAEIIEFNEKQRQRIKDMRLADLKQIQEVSVISLLPISFASFLLGYYISGRYLSPLKILKEKISKLRHRDLGSQVDINTKGEIGELADSFNEMSIRLKYAFDSQAQFVQDASHELRTPLTIIQTNLDIAIDEENNPLEMKKAVNRALLGMKRVNRLTESLLDLSMPENIQFQVKDLGNLIKEQINMLRDFAKEENVKLEYSRPLEGKYIAKIDPVQLGRALFNLIDNAIKYSKQVNNPFVKVRIFKKKEQGLQYYRIEVVDNGCGIPKIYQSKIFDRFYRVDKSRSRASGGFGLGLAIAKKIVEEHKGKIGFNSNEKGTTFWIEIPYEAEEFNK